MMCRLLQTQPYFKSVHIEATHLGASTMYKNAWVDKSTMLQWIEQILKPWKKKKNPATMLLLDKFKGHITADVQFVFAECNCQLEYIPSSYTRRLQVHDVGLKKPFKNCVCNTFDS